MTARIVNVYYDPEGDFLDVIFDRAPGYFIDTDRDEVMSKVAMDGRFIGFQIIGVTKLKGAPIEVKLTP